MLDPVVSLAGLLVGLIVGLTGMGGGALMTPILVLLFGIEPLTAVSSDVVASMIMKPLGGAVHWRRGTVHRGLVFWLALGSIPSAFLGVLALKSLGDAANVQSFIKHALGVALLAVVAGVVVRPLLVRSRQADEAGAAVRARPLVTLAIGVLGGFVVGITSVGSGSLMIVLLLMAYPRLRLSELVGTDLVQAVPLVASAALGHLLFGDFKLNLTASILIGSLPGVYVGARVSSRAPDWIIRPVLAIVILASGLKLLGVGTGIVGGIAGVALVIGAVHVARNAQAARRSHHVADVTVAPTTPIP